MLKKYQMTGELKLKNVVIENHSVEYGRPMFNAIPLDSKVFRCPSQGVGHGCTKRQAVNDLKRINLTH